jgi:ParB-like nuclease family protein
MPPTTKPTPSWRDVLPIHPAAELFPLMSADELRALAEDIRQTGLTQPIILWRANKKATAQLLDGRNRLDAIEIVIGGPVIISSDGKNDAGVPVLWADPSITDPYAYVISANIHRRHLTIEDKDRLIVDVLKADPSKSNRQVAKMVGASHPHVAKVRGQAEKAGDVETVTTSVDTKGASSQRSASPATPSARGFIMR